MNSLFSDFDKGGLTDKISVGHGVCGVTRKTV